MKCLKLKRIFSGSDKVSSILLRPQQNEILSRGNDYQSHTKCITEEQKYCGKGYVPKVNKGEVKQEIWIEKVQSAIENSKSNPKLKGVLERLKDYPNIPRKKAKFEANALTPHRYLPNRAGTTGVSRNDLLVCDNFLRNSLRVNSDQLITQVWDTLMANAGPDSGTQNGNANKDKTIDESVTHKMPTNNIQEVDEIEENNKKTKKEKNKNDYANNAEERKEERKKIKVIEKEDTVQEETDEKSAQGNGDSQLHGDSDINGHKLSKRDRKEERRKKANKKEKKDKSENNCSNEGGKGKKRKLSEYEETEAIVENPENTKKKKSKSTEDIESVKGNTDPELTCDDRDEENDEETLEPKRKKSKKTKFNWEATILTVLKSKGEISLKKLQKKVLNEFAAQDAANYSEDNLRAKFQKKINKMAKVKVSKDRVRLK